MRENVAIDDKLQGEERRYGFDWTPYLATGDSPTAPPAAIQTLYGAVGNIPQSTLAGNVQTFEIEPGGTVGAAALLLEIGTTQGETLQQVVTLRIL